MNRYLVEAIGTFFLVLTIALCATAGMSPVATGLAAGSILMVMVYAGGPISGAHYNPAITFSMIMRGRTSLADAMRYMSAQLIGAIIAAIVAWFLQGETFAPEPGIGITVAQAFVAEAVFTFALALVYLRVMTGDQTTSNAYFGIAIGFTMLAGVIAVLEISGAAFNTALGLGPIIVDTIVGPGGFGNVVLYILGPFAGAALAAVVDGRMSD